MDWGLVASGRGIVDLPSLEAWLMVGHQLSVCAQIKWIVVVACCHTCSCVTSCVNGNCSECVYIRNKGFVFSLHPASLTSPLGQAGVLSQVPTRPITTRLHLPPHLYSLSHAPDLTMSVWGFPHLHQALCPLVYAPVRLSKKFIN